MTTMRSSSPVLPRQDGLLSQVLGSRRFLAAAGLLILSIVGWYVLVWWLGFALDKEPVPWPDGVEVDKEFVMTSFPEMFPVIAPRYALMSSKRWNEHAISEREAKAYLSEDTRIVLGVGQAVDAPRRVDRESNWYMSRIYGDLRWLNPQYAGKISSPFWQLDVTYYTGAVDTVTHVPGRCMIAAGARPLTDKVLTWTNLPENALGWKDIQVVRSAFESTDAHGQRSTVLQYYTFSVNGHNEEDWRKVRWTMAADIRQTYVYFGKIQFAPRTSLAPLAGNTADALKAAEEEWKVTDEAAEQFFRAATVAILSTFPSAGTVEELNRRSASPKKPVSERVPEPVDVEVK